MGCWVGQAGGQCSGPCTAAARWGTGSRLPAPCRMGNRGTQHPALWSAGWWTGRIWGSLPRHPQSLLSPPREELSRSGQGHPAPPAGDGSHVSYLLLSPGFSVRGVFSALRGISGGAGGMGTTGLRKPRTTGGCQGTNDPARLRAVPQNPWARTPWHPPARCPQGGVPVTPLVGGALEGSQQGPTPRQTP